MRLRRSFVALFFAIAAIGLSAGPAGASYSVPHWDLDLGIGPDGVGTLSSPSRITTDPYGRVIVSKASGLQALAASGESSFTVPEAAAPKAAFTDHFGVTWFGVGTTLHRVDALGVALADPAYTIGVEADGFAADPTSPRWGDVLYIADAGALDVVSATDVSATGIFGQIAVDAPAQILVNLDHTLLVLHPSTETAKANTVERFSDQGVPLGSWRVPSPPDGSAVAVSSMAADGASNLVFTDTLGHRIIRTTRAGQFLSTFGRARTVNDDNFSAFPPPGTFDNPVDIHVDCRGRLFVLDLGRSATTGRIARYSNAADPTGTCAAETPYTRTPASGGNLTVDAAGQTYENNDYGVITKRGPTGALVATLGHLNPTAGTQDFGLASGLGILPGGDVLIATFGYNVNGNGLRNLDPKLLRLHAAGSFVSQFRSVTDGVTTYTFGRTGRLVVRPSDGHVLVIDAPFVSKAVDGQVTSSGVTNIVELTSSLHLVRVIALQAVPGGAGVVRTGGAIALKPADGSVYVAVRERGSDGLYRGNIQHFGVSGAAVPADTIPLPSIAGSSAATTGLVVRPDGTLLLSVDGNIPSSPSGYDNASTYGLDELRPNGQVVRRRLEGVLGAFEPTALAIDCKARVLVSAGQQPAIYHINYGSGACIWKPTATTGALVARSTTALKVRTYTNPAAQPTLVRVLYGTTASHGRYTPWVSLPSDNVLLTRDITITGLTTKHGYHYQVQVQNASGVVTGADRTAVTA